MSHAELLIIALAWVCRSAGIPWLTLSRSKMTAIIWKYWDRIREDGSF